MAIEHFTSRSGIDVYIERVPGMKNIDTELIVKVGSLDEPDELAGVCHALEHCTHLRTPSFDGSPSINRFADRHAFTRNADTYYTRTNYYAKGLQPEPMLQLLSELTFGARFHDDEVAAEMKSVRREALTALDDIDDISYNFYDYTLFGVPYGREILGYHDRLTFDAKTLERYYTQYYAADNMALVVVGDVTSDKVATLMDRYFDGVRRKAPAKQPLPMPGRPNEDVPAFGYLREDSANARLCLQAAVPLDFVERYEAGDWAYSAAIDAVWRTVFNRVRFEMGLSYDGSFSLAGYNHRTARRLKAEVMVDPADVQKGLTALRDVLKRSPEDYPDERLQETLASQARVSAGEVDQVLDRAVNYAEAIAYGSPLISVEESYARLQATTLADVRHALSDVLTIWNQGDVLECVVGPHGAIGDRMVVDQSLFA